MVKQLWKSNVKYIRPTTLRTGIKKWKQAFNNNQQQDAHKFFTCLSDEIDSETTVKGVSTVYMYELKQNVFENWSFKLKSFIFLSSVM